MSVPTPGGTTESITTEQAAVNLLKLIPDDVDTEEQSEPQQAEPVAAEEEEAPESDTDSGEESESDEAPESTEPPAPASRKLKVKIDDVETELPEDEVVKGYQRNADYTRKTQHVAELRKSLEADAASVKAERSELSKSLSDIKATLETHLGKEPDWEALKGDPSFGAKYAEWDLGQKNLAKVNAAQQEIARRDAVDSANARNELLKVESEKLKDVIPSWKDEAVAKTEKAELVTYARSKGLSLIHI